MPDLRNSRVPDIIDTLQQFGVSPLVHDPLASAVEAREEYGIELRPLEDLTRLDALIIAVAHRDYLEGATNRLSDRIVDRGVLIDVKSVVEGHVVRPGIRHWSL